MVGFLLILHYHVWLLEFFFVELTVLQLTWKRISARSRIGEQHDSPSFLFLFIDVYIMMFIGDISVVYMAIISFPSWAHRSQAENASGDISGSLIAPWRWATFSSWASHPAAEFVKNTCIRSGGNRSSKYKNRMEYVYNYVYIAPGKLT